MNIVYFGTDVFLNVFEFLREHHNIVALYTYHNSEDYFTERGVVQLAHLSGIPVFYSKITEQQMRDYVELQGCELFFVAEYNSRLPIPKGLPHFRAVNTHSSLLPQGRSYYPIEIALSKKLRTGGVTLHKLTEALDEGDILVQKEFVIPPEDDSIDVYLRCSAAARALTAALLADFEGFWSAAKAQPTVLPFWKRPLPEELVITHSMTVAQAQQIYRSFNKMSRVIIDAMPYFIESFMTGNVPVGTADRDIIFINDRRVIYGLRDGNIRIDLECAQEEK